MAPSIAPLKANTFNAYRHSEGAASDRSDRSSSGSSSLGGMKKRRMYDRSYRTHEPLPGKPPVDFDEKLWDLGEEAEGGGADTSLTTSDETHSDMSSKAVYRHSRETVIY